MLRGLSRTISQSKALRLYKMEKINVDKKGIWKFSTLLVVLLIFLASVHFVIAQEAQSRFRFVVFGDMHLGCSDSSLTEAQKKALDVVINEVKPAFVLQAGDLISIANKDQSQSTACLNTMYSKLKKEVIEPLNGAGILFFYSVGNHDGYMPGAYTSQTSKDMHESFWSSQTNNGYTISGPGYGKYYSFDYGNSHFISLLAPGTFGLSNSNEQMVWLGADLENAKTIGAKHIFTFAHSPLSAPNTWWGTTTRIPGRQFLESDRQFMSLLKTYNVEANFGAHWHIFKDDYTEGVRDVIAGMLGGHKATIEGENTPVPWTFTVIDVDGDKSNLYRIEWPFNTQSLPSAPVVDKSPAKVSAPQSVASLGTCPPGTRPAPPGMQGTMSAIGGGVGVSTSSPSGTSGNNVLDAAHKYAGRAYGTGSGEFVCTTFIVQLLRDLGLKIDSDAEKILNIIPPQGKTPSNLVDNNDPVHKGVQYALEKSGLGEAVPAASAQAGDLVQYWQKDSSGWVGCAAVIEKVNDDGTVDLFGAQSKETGVAVSKSFNLQDADKKVYVARLKQASGVSSGKPQATASQPVAVAQSSGAAGCGAKIAVVGDSISALSSYVVQLRQLCGPATEIKNEDGDPSTSQDIRGTDKFAFVGKRTSQMKADFDAVLATNPDTVIILGGTNDVGGSWSSIRDNLLDIYARAKAANKRVVALTVPPLRNSAKRSQIELDNIKKINAWILSEAPVDVRVNIYDSLVSPAEPDAANPALFASDLVHPNQNGKQVIAQKVYDALIGAPAQATAPAGTQTIASAASSSSGPRMMCIPESVLPKMLYDFIINSSAGITTIIGIARQNIAIGINKTIPPLIPDSTCVPLTADKNYDSEFLKSTYGRTALEVESQLQKVPFMGVDVQIHRLVIPALACVEQDIKNCEEGRNYKYRNVESYNWQGLEDQPDVLSTSSFGISLNINLDSNPNAQNGQLITDMPQCVVSAFKKYGFKWGGDFQPDKTPAHFEFMADPRMIAIASASVCPGGKCVPSAEGKKTVARGQGDVVIIYAGDGKDWQEFKRVATLYAEKYGGTAYPAYNAQDIIDAVRKHKSISRLVIAAHGMAYGILKPGAKGIRIGADSLPNMVSAETFAGELGPRLTQGAVIGLAACNTGKNPGDPGNWDAKSYISGGEKGLAAKIRDALAMQAGIADGIEVRAHTTAGHTTRNPAVRRFVVSSSEIGKPGKSVLDEALGEGTSASGTIGGWNQKFGGFYLKNGVRVNTYSYAQDWLAGDAVTFEMSGGVAINVA